MGIGEATNKDRRYPGSAVLNGVVIMANSFEYYPA